MVGSDDAALKMPASKSCLFVLEVKSKDGEPAQFELRLDGTTEVLPLALADNTPLTLYKNQSKTYRVALGDVPADHEQLNLRCNILTGSVMIYGSFSEMFPSRERSDLSMALRVGISDHLQQSQQHVVVDLPADRAQSGQPMRLFLQLRSDEYSVVECYATTGDRNHFLQQSERVQLGRVLNREMQDVDKRNINNKEYRIKNFLFEVPSAQESYFVNVNSENLGLTICANLGDQFDFDKGCSLSSKSDSLFVSKQFLSMHDGKSLLISVQQEMADMAHPAHFSLVVNRETGRNTVTVSKSGAVTTFALGAASQLELVFDLLPMKKSVLVTYHSDEPLSAIFLTVKDQVLNAMGPENFAFRITDVKSFKASYCGAECSITMHLVNGNFPARVTVAFVLDDGLLHVGNGKSLALPGDQLATLLLRKRKDGNSLKVVASSRNALYSLFAAFQDLA